MALGGDEGETANRPRPVRSEGGVNGYSHRLNGSSEACLQPPEVGNASVMLKEGIGSTCNHFGSSWVTSTLRAAAYGDEFTALFRSSHEQNATTVSSFELKEGGTRPHSSRSFILYGYYIVYPTRRERPGESSVASCPRRGRTGRPRGTPRRTPELAGLIRQRMSGEIAGDRFRLI